MQAQRKLLSKLLQLLQLRMQQAGLWQVSPPAATAFSSQEPFCVDTMALEQWLKHLFIPRMQAILDAEAPLPSACSLTPQVEMQLDHSSQALVSEVTLAIDLLLTEGKVPAASLLKQAGG